MAPSTTPVATPKAVAHLLMDWGNNTLQQIKDQWSKIRFDAVDVLNVSAFIVDPKDKKSFVIDPAYPVFPDLMKWLTETARSQNKNIKILAQQFYGDTSWVSLTKTEIDHYAQTVAGIVKDYELDGYDCDYEWGTKKVNDVWVRVVNNDVPEAPTIMAAVRRELDQMSTTLGRPLYVTLSPAFTEQFTKDNQAAVDHPISKSVHWVNIQTYDGGSNEENTIESWTGLGFSKSQLTYGIWPENSLGEGGKDSPSMSDVQEAYKSNSLGGINLWRLSSDNFIFESQVQVLVYNYLHGGALPNTPKTEDVQKNWDAGHEAQKLIKSVV